MDIEKWKFINTFAPWLSALGTISAVVASLYLAFSRPIKLKITAGHRLISEPGVKGPHPEFLYISAINTGHHPAIITGISWSVGLFKKTYMIQLIQETLYSSKLPVKIEYGEEAKWLIPLDKDDNWFSILSADFLLSHPRWDLLRVRLLIHTSVGKTFKTKIERGLRNKLLEEYKKQRNSQQI